MVLKSFSAFLFSTLIALNIQAHATCFVAKEKGEIVKQQGELNKRHSPFSTFKIPLALMGFDSGILKNSEAPLWQYTHEIEKSWTPWYMPNKYPIQMFGARAQTPSSWMKYSVVWYSQEITKLLGMDKFKGYVSKLGYGNGDVSGNKGKNDGLLTSWLDSSLQISPLEQVEFMEKLSKRELPISRDAQENTIKLIALEDIYDGWKLYGKTGGGKERGWFVGWVEKDNRRIIFTQYIEIEKNPISGGRIAKELAKDNLISLILSSQS